MESKVYTEFKQIEEVHWWFVARREILRSILADFFLFPHKAKRVLDVGPGPGINIPMLRQFSEAIVCIEPSRESAEEIRKTHPDVRAFHGTFPETVVEGKFDLITFFDVLEHIENEQGTLAAIKTYLASDGLCVLTVPAYTFLWSEHDDIVHHKRRYTKRMLEATVRKAGFDIVRTSYFNTFLFPPIALVRVLKNMIGNRRDTSDFSITPGWSNTVLKHIFLLEKWFLRYVNFPFGVSIVCVFRHKNTPVKQ